MKNKYQSFGDVSLARESKQKKRAVYIPIISVFAAILLIHGISPHFKSDLQTYFFSSNLELLENPNLTLRIINNTSKCKLCTYTVRNTQPNSTPRDVIICNAIGTAKNEILFVKTLRTTGSKASCVFLVDSHAYGIISQETKQIVESCGGQIINCGPVPYHKKLDGHNYCYVFSAYFIENNIKNIDRIIICDMYDTVFQGDPFNMQLENDKLNIIDEGATFSTRPGENNREWLLAFNYTLPKEKYQDYYLCSGFIGGKAEIVLKTLKLYLKQHTFGQKKHDQAAFNYLYFSGILAAHNISINKMRNNELVRHISYIPLGNHTSIGDIRGIRNDTIYATVIHHYYLDSEFVMSLLKYCPRESKTLKYYLGRIKETKVIQMEQQIKSNEFNFNENQVKQESTINNKGYIQNQIQFEDKGISEQINTEIKTNQKKRIKTK